MIPPLRIALCGGGVKGIAHVGALDVLQKRGLLKCVREYIGTSAGAMMGLCLAVGYTIAELTTLCTVFDFRLMTNLEPDAMLQASELYGLDNGANLEKLLGVLLRMKGFPVDCTFAQLEQLQCTRGLPRLGLRVYAADVEQGVPREFQARTTPNTSIVLAVRASMSVPVFFTPVRDPETGHLLVDGGVISNFPFQHLTDEERAETLGIAFDQSYKFCAPTGSAEALRKSMTFPEYILQLYYTVYGTHTRELLQGWSDRIVLLPQGNFPSLQFDATMDAKLELIQAGREGAEAFFKRRYTPAPRRNSAP